MEVFDNLTGFTSASVNVIPRNDVFRAAAVILARAKTAAGWSHSVTLAEAVR